MTTAITVGQLGSICKYLGNILVVNHTSQPPGCPHTATARKKKPSHLNMSQEYPISPTMFSDSDDETIVEWVPPEPAAKRLRLSQAGTSAQHGRDLVLPAASGATEPRTPKGPLNRVPAQVSGVEEIPCTPSQEMPKLPAAATSAAPAEGSKWRLQCKRLFLTYPKCSTAPKTVLANIKAKWGAELEWAVIGQEKHQDGTLHLHAAISVKGKYSSRNARDLDSLAGSHGEYRAMKRQAECVGYCIKEGNYVEEGIDAKELVEQHRKKQSGKMALVAKAVQDGATLEELDEDHAGIVLQHMPKIEAYAAFQEEKRTRELQKPWVAPDPELFHSHQDKLIAIWLADNIRKNRQLRKKQLWITGPTRCGKSTLIANLRKFLQVYTAPQEEDFYGGFDNKHTDVVVFEEFGKGMKPVSFMLSFCSGEHMVIAKKGSQVTKTKNVPVIVISNRTCEECYHKLKELKPQVFAAVKDRFHHVTLVGEAKINVLFDPADVEEEDAVQRFARENEIDLNAPFE